MTMLKLTSRPRFLTPANPASRRRYAPPGRSACALALLLFAAGGASAQLPWQESFETDGLNNRYFASEECTDGAGDFFIRTDGSNIGSFYQVSGQDGSFYYAGMDLDGSPCTSPATDTLTFRAVDISGASSLVFKGLFAEDDDGTNQDWDDSDEVFIEYSIDGGAFVKLLQFAEIDDGDAFNQEPGLDTNFDGVAEGPALTSSFAEFSAPIAVPLNSSELTLRITLTLNSGDEDIAFDNFRLEAVSDNPGDAAPTVLSTTPGNNDSDVAVDANIEVVFSEPVTVTSGLWFDIDCSVSGNNLTATDSSADSTTFSLDLAADLAFAETCTVTILASEVQDQDGDADNLPSDVVFSFTTTSAPAGSTAVFINELHYDNSSSDVDEFVEIAGPAGTDLSGWSIVLYNGNGGASYGTVNLTETLTDLTGTGFGFSAVFRSGIQNGSPDGLALVDANGVVQQFLSYEGSFTAANGPASGLTSTDIGVAESGGTPLGQSLQLTGDGTVYEDFIWASPAAATDGCVNVEQRFAGGALSCDGAPTLATIPEIQGGGSATTFAGVTVTTSGIVTGDFQGVAGSDQLHPEQLSGFFLQDPEGDGDPGTSDGIFVYCGSCSTDVQVGDAVTVTGEADEFFGKTQINVSNGSVLVTSSENALPVPVPVDLPVNAVDDLEVFEGMLVEFVDTLSASEYFEVSRFGEVLLYEGGRPFQFTHDSTPDAAGFAAHQANLARRRIILDDDANGSNQALEQDLNIFHPIPGLSTANFFRGGDSITGLKGVLDFGFSEYRVRPIVGVFDYSFQQENPRPLSPASVGGSIKVVSANVLNYFTTIDLTASRSSGDCSPSGTLDCRGADSASELERQTAKLSAALCAINGDIVGLSEIENDAAGDTSLRALVGALNSVTGCGPYSFIDAGPLGTDAIKVAFIYRSETVTPFGPSLVVDDSVDPGYRDQKNRPTLIQVFEELATGQRLIVATHHLKSKGSDCEDVGDPDLNDGQGNCSQTRKAAAGIVADYIANVVIPGNDLDEIPAAGTDRVLVIGDLNAYKKEEAITEFTGAERGYVDLIEAFNGNSAYSFVFDGQRGYLDHALGLNLLKSVTEVAEWHINADEINMFDYNDDVLDVGERDFEEKPDNLPLFEANPYRSSDHDPVIIGLNLGPTLGPVEGDLDGDGSVDMNDYFVFISVFRQPASASATAAEADYNGNGVVDFIDFGIWRGHFLAFARN